MPTASPLLVVLALAFGPAALRAAQDPPEERLASHRRMVAALEEVRAESERTNPYTGRAELDSLRARLRRGERRKPARRWRLLRRLAFHLLRLGRTAEAVATLEEAAELLPEVAPQPSAAEVARSRIDLALAYLRLAEDRNCVARHTGASCLLPIADGGVHVDQEASRAAIAVLRQVLAEDPREDCAAWLLNLACMTVGEWPEAVPEAHRVDPARFESGGPFPRFPDVAPELGLNSFNMCGGVVTDDFDGDGDPDLITSSWGTGDRLLYFRNDGGGAFVERGSEAGLDGITGGLNLVHADYDGDGDLDVLVLRGAWLRENGRYPNSLLQNQGDGTFLDVSFAAGLGEVHYPGQAGAFADYDNDGDLDLFVGNETYPGVEAPCQLFQNRGDGTFVDVAEAAGVTNDRYAKAASWGDYDGDRFPDLFVSNQNTPNRLYHNQGDGTFVDVAEPAGVARPLASFPAWFWDFDNDGNLDLYVSAYWPELAPHAAYWLGRPFSAELPALFCGDGRGRFFDVAHACGVDQLSMPMGANFGDIDSDGWLDFYLGTGYPGYDGLLPNLFYHSLGGERFADVTTAGGFGHLQKGHGVAFCDLDGDADVDLFAEMGGAFPGDAFGNALFENPGFGNHWIRVRLIGVRSNRFGIGARIRCRITERGESRDVYRWVNSGGSFGGSPLTQRVGLGRAGSIDELEVWWPTSDTTQVFEHVEVDRSVRIAEDRDELLSWP